MKLQEVYLTEEELDEKLKHAVAAAAIAFGALGAPKNADGPSSPPPPATLMAAHKKQQAMKEIEEMAKVIQAKYKVDKQKASEIIQLAQKYEKKTFPRVKDILSVVAIESSFKQTSVSPLKNDPAMGLMQVRPGVWGLEKSDLSTPEKQIKVGVDILHKYYEKLGSEDKALHAYNIGITNFRRGTGLNPAYVEKFKKARTWIEDAIEKIKEKEDPKG